MANENNAGAEPQPASGEKFTVKVPWGELGPGAGGARTWHHNPNVALSRDEQYRQNVANGFIVESESAAEMDLARRIGMHLATTTAIDAVTAGKLAVDIVKMLPGADQPPAGYIDRKDLVRLSNCRATIWPGTNEIDAVPVYLGAAAVPEGWQMVPKEPTIAMIAALGWAGDEVLAVGHGLISKGISEDYAAMLAAAPDAGSAT